jgi:hypothetical protein
MTPDQGEDGRERNDDAPQATVGTASSIGPLGVDELFAVLSRPGNRFVLTYLLMEDTPVSLVDLVEYVLEETEPPADVQRAEFSGQVLNRFMETTLPELDDRGLIDYDRRSQMVAETDATTLTLPYLRAGLQQTAAEAPEREP